MKAVHQLWSRPPRVGKRRRDGGTTAEASACSETATATTSPFVRTASAPISAGREFALSRQPSCRRPRAQPTRTRRWRPSPEHKCFSVWNWAAACPRYWTVLTAFAASAGVNVGRSSARDSRRVRRRPLAPPLPSPFATPGCLLAPLQRGRLHSPQP